MRLTILLQSLLETARWYEPEVTIGGLRAVIHAWLGDGILPSKLISKGIVSKHVLQQIGNCSTSSIIDIDDVVDRESQTNPSVIGSIFRDLVVSASDGNLDPVIGRDLELNTLIQSLCRRKKNNVIITGTSGVGKAQPLYSKILTPDGWIEMREIKVGTIVSTPSGGIAKVTGVYPQGKKDIYRMHFADGRMVDSSDEHLWMVWNCYDRPGWQIKTTKEILLRSLENQHDRVYVPLIKSAQYKKKDLPMDPYLLGILIGDGYLGCGTPAFFTGDNDILCAIRKIITKEYIITKCGTYNYRIAKRKRNSCIPNFYTNKLKELGLHSKISYEKFIPEIYKNADPESRMELIRGLMDSDGTVSISGSPSFSTTSLQLAKDMQEMIWSIGGICTIAEKRTSYTYNGKKKKGRLSYNVQIRFCNPRELFHLKRKQNRTPRNYQYSDLKLEIVAIDYLGKDVCQCIVIDDSEQLYITDNYVVTHNTALVEKLAQRIADGVVPPQLQRVPIYVFNVVQLESMNAGLLKTLIKELEESNIIIFIDEIHLLMSPQYKSISELLKPVLTWGRFRCIGATTREEYVRHLSDDAAFRRRFERLDLDELSEEDTLDVLRGLCSIYEEEYNVTIPPEVLLSIVRFSKRYLSGVFPDKCIDTLEQVCVRKTMPRATKNYLRTSDFVLHHESQSIATPNRQCIESSDVKATIELSAKTKICDISRNAIEEKLTDEIVGMSEQIVKIIPVILKSHNIHRITGALGSMLFAGRDGTGREYTARRICNLLFGSEGPFLEIDIDYYSDHYNVSKLVGAPAGYIGYEYGGGLLAKYVRDHPNGVIFLKNLEADRSSIAMTLFKKAIETGKITTASGLELDFRNHLFIGSYNESSSRILGFGERSSDSIPDFPFLHPVIHFYPLDKVGIIEVIHREFTKKMREMASQGIVLVVDKGVLDHIGELSSSVTEAMGIFNREIIDQIGYEDVNIFFTMDKGRIKKECNI